MGDDGKRCKECGKRFEGDGEFCQECIAKQLRKSGLGMMPPKFEKFTAENMRQIEKDVYRSHNVKWDK